MPCVSLAHILIALLFLSHSQTTFKGRVFMTHATKAIYRWLLSDYIKVRCVVLVVQNK